MGSLKPVAEMRALRSVSVRQWTFPRSHCSLLWTHFLPPASALWALPPPREPLSQELDTPSRTVLVPQFCSLQFPSSSFCKRSRAVAVPAPSLLTGTAGFQNSKGQDAVKRPWGRDESCLCLTTHGAAVEVYNCPLWAPLYILKITWRSPALIRKKNDLDTINSQCQVEMKCFQSCYLSVTSSPSCCCLGHQLLSASCSMSICCGKGLRNLNLQNQMENRHGIRNRKHICWSLR